MRQTTGSYQVDPVPRAENRSAYAFSLYRLVGTRLQSILSGRHWPPFVLLLCVLIYLPSLLSGYFADDNWHRLEFTPAAIQKLGIPEHIVRKGPTDLYAFTGKNPERMLALRDKGIIPWWTSESSKINFFRPLSSLTLALDYRLWPDLPLLAHAHSLLWFLLLVLLVYRVYRDILNSAALAGLGVLLFALDDVHSGAGWISNRHAVVSMVFGVLCLLLYHQGRQRKDARRVYLSYAAMVAALLASEMAVAVLAYLLAYSLFLERNDLRSTAVQVLPFVAIVVAWRLLYALLGYGVAGSVMYVDPVRAPVGFLRSALTRFPLLLFSTIGFPIADVSLLASPQGSFWLAIAASILAAIIILCTISRVKRHPTTAFWWAGLLCALLPLCASFARNTVLGFASLGAMPLFAILLVQIARTPASALPTWFGKLPLRLTLPLLIFAHLILAPLYTAFLIPGSFETGRQRQVALVAFGDSPDLHGQDVILVNPPSVAMIEAGLLARLYSEQTFPAHVRALSSGKGPLEIQRLDEKTLIVTVENGFAPPPASIPDARTGRHAHFHPDNLGRRTDSFYYDPNLPPHKGASIQLTGLTIQVLDLTPGGHITQARFAFEKPLEDPHYLWLWWDSESQSYDRYPLPLTW